MRLSPSDLDGTPASQSADGPPRDLLLVAEQRNLSLVEARELRVASQALSRIAHRIADRHPGAFAGTIAPRFPDQAPVLLVKGHADARVRQIVSDESPVDIHIEDLQPYSAQELEARARKVHEAALELGHQNIATFPDLDGRIRALRENWGR